MTKKGMPWIYMISMITIHKIPFISSIERLTINRDIQLARNIFFQLSVKPPAYAAAPSHNVCTTLDRLYVQSLIMTHYCNCTR
jgi:hypothetical protein